MSEKHQQTSEVSRGKQSVFLRFRHGTRLTIDPDIRETLNKVCSDLLKTADHRAYFRENIRSIADGSGLGVHPESTWFAAIRELFQRYEDEHKSINDETRTALLDVLKLLASSTIEKKWDSIRKLVLENIDILSGWYRREQHIGELYKDVQRNADGTYTKEEEGRTVHILGIKTFDEERYEYIAGSGIHQYGTLYYLFKLISLVDIADQFNRHPEHFTDKMFCLLHDNDGETHYLGWNWSIHGVYDLNPVFWSPRSCYSNPEWLANDVMSSYSAKFDKKDPTSPRVPYEPTDQFKEVFSGYRWQLELTLNTNLILGDDLEYYFEFGDRHIRWINGDRFTEPMIVIPTNDEKGEDALKLGLRFTSVISKHTDQSITTNVESVNQIRHAPFFSQPRISMFYKFSPEYLLPSENVEDYTDAIFTAVALRREAVSSNSVFYKFLSFYKIIELSCDSMSANVETWINGTVANSNEDNYYDSAIKSWRENTLPDGETAYEYLYGSNRCAIAHINRSNTRGQGHTDPDDPVDYLRVKYDVNAIKQLADKAIKLMPRQSARTRG
jgi:hypothetical protein